MADLNCAAFVFDEMDCAPRCEETPDAAGDTCMALVTRDAVLCNSAIDSGYDCSCTCGDDGTGTGTYAPLTKGPGGAAGNSGVARGGDGAGDPKWG